MAENKRDYYEVLGIDRAADEAAIKRAYRGLAKKYHPDANPGNKEAEAKFKEASEAYAVLVDPEKRARYDQFGHAAFDGSAGGPGVDFNSAHFTDIFGDLFGDLFGGFAGFGTSSRTTRSNRGYPASVPGANVRIRIPISFMEAIRGCTKELDLNLKETCPDCKGSGAKPGTSPVTCSKCGGNGQVTVSQRTIFGMSQSVRVCPGCSGTGKIIKERCPRCGGSGYVSRRQKVQVTIPAGISNGQSVRIRGKGEPGIGGGPFGDLLVEVVVGEDPQFIRDGIDIYSTVSLSFVQATLGATLRIPTVHGDVEYELKGATQPGTQIRLRGKGVPNLRQKEEQGDHYVTFTVQVPDKLNKAQKDALMAFDKAIRGVADVKPAKKGRKRTKQS